MRPVLAVAVLALVLAGCARRRVPEPVPSPHYVVGAGYQAGGTWFYPREDFHYNATGLAVVQGVGRGLTADGEAVDPSALTAAHQTLQLPAIARVTNLETGLQVAVRINDRGPDTPKRLIALSRRAGELLGIVPGAVAAVRVEVDEAMSVAVRDQVQGGPRLAVQAAPRGAVVAESLAPPAGIGQSARGRSAGTTQAATAGSGAAAAVPDRLPETVSRGVAGRGALALDAGHFGQMGYARQVAARLSGIGARVDRVREGRTERYRVMAGPFASVAAADAALDRAMAAGVTDVGIVIE